MPIPANALELVALGPIGTAIGHGGQADVFEVPRLSLPDVRGPLVYKQYKTPPVSTAGLDMIVAARSALGQPGRERLDRMAAWPVRTVVEQGALRGIVMPRISDGYFDDVRMPGSGGTQRKLRDVQNLFIRPEVARWLGRPDPDVEQRLRVCRDFAGALRYLHDELNFMFGDISSTNEVYRLDRTPTVMFLDCDGLRRPGSVSSADQLNTPDWVPPEGGALTVATDLYKLGLFILRCLTPGDQCSTSTDPTAALPDLDETGGDLLMRAVSADPAGRPSAAEWHRHLSLLLGDPVDPPSVLRADLDRSFVCAGAPVAVSWDVASATTVEITAHQRTEQVDGRPGTGVTTIVPERTCFIRLVVRNDLGTAERMLGPVAVIDAPRIDHQPVSLPDFPTPYLGDLVWPRFTLPEIPALGRPSAPIAALLPAIDEPARQQPPFWPALQSVRCPIDVATLLTTAPELDFGIPFTPEETS
jgi:hypothetical protein